MVSVLAERVHGGANAGAIGYAGQSTSTSPGMQVKWTALCVTGGRPRLKRDAGDLQVELGEGCAGPAVDVLQFGVATSRGSIERQNRNDLEKFIHEGKILGQTFGSVRAKHMFAHRHSIDSLLNRSS